jgi:hypothetical protein
MSWFYVFVNEAKRVWQAGPFITYNDAVKVGLVRGQQYEIKKYNTRDPNRAKSIYNAELYEQGKPIEDIKKRHFKIKGV